MSWLPSIDSANIRRRFLRIVGFDNGNGLAFSLHANVATVLKHFPRDVPRNCHEGLLWHAGFGQPVIA